MTSGEFRTLLRLRSDSAGIEIPPRAIEALDVYYQLLARWNARMNLTALSLDQLSSDAVDRLFIEPLAAARYFPDIPLRWLDLGSGGGSPAVPLKIVRPLLKLTMVEAKARKAAFLREVVRTLELSAAEVEHARFEELAEQQEHSHGADLVTVRAVRLNEATVGAVRQLLAKDGCLMLFRLRNSPSSSLAGFEVVGAPELWRGSTAEVAIFRPTFHVEQSEQGEQSH